MQLVATTILNPTFFAIIPPAGMEKPWVQNPSADNQIASLSDKFGLTYVLR